MAVVPVRNICVLILGVFHIQGVGFAADEAIVRMPVRVSTIKVDGVVDVAEWADAAVIRQIPAVGQQLHTVFRVTYDATSLYVAAECEEHATGGPTALTRGQMACVTQDDAVEVAICTGEADQVKTINVGGYAGAMGQTLPTMTRLEEFIVNAAGSVERRRNESPMAARDFEAAVRTTNNDWYAEWRIPWTSAGLANGPESGVWVNLLRFRPPDRTAWRGMSGWGNYTPFPVGKMICLPASRSAERTIEAVTGDPPTNPSAATPPADEFVYFPLARTVLGRVSPRQGEVMAAIRIGDDVKPSAQGALQERATTQMRVEVGPTRAKQAALEIFDANGMLTRRLSAPIAEDSPRPEWCGTAVAKAYERECVPKPWTPPTIDGNTVTLTTAKLQFDNSPLPTAIAAETHALLAAPIRIDLRRGEATVPLTFGEPQVTADGIDVVARSSAAIQDGQCNVTTRVEYDGFMTVDVGLAGQSLAEITHIAMVVPMRAAAAKFVNRGSVQDTLRLDAGGWMGSAGRLWVGTECSGLAFSCDAAVFASKDLRRQMTISYDNEAAVWQTQFVDGPGQIRGDRWHARFYLHVTPTKPPTLETPNAKVALWFENWSDYQGFPDLKKMAEVKAASAKAHAEGRLSLLYFNQMLASNAPGFAEHRAELLATPEKMWYQRAYDPGRNVPCYVCCVCGPYGDLLLDGIDRLVREGAIDGVYMDGTTVVWDCDNPAHRCCVHTDNEASDAGPILGTRRFLKRLRGVFDQHGRPFMLIAHTGGGLDINTLSLVDHFWEGEQLARYLPGYRIPLDVFAVGYSGRPFGLSTTFYDQAWRGARGENLSVLYALLHHTELQSAPMERFYAAYRDAKTAAFLPYWQSESPVTVRSERGTTVCSVYRRDDRAMVVVGNMGHDDDKVTVDLSGLFGGKTIIASNRLANDARVAVADGQARLTLAAWRGCVLDVRPLAEEASGSPPTRPAESSAMNTVSWRIDGYRASDWAVNTDGAGVTAKHDVAIRDRRAGLMIGSVLYQSAAIATLKDRVFGSSFEARLTIQGSRRLRIAIGDIVIAHDGAWSVEGPIDGWSEGSVSHPAWIGDRDVELRVSLRNGLMSASYDGQPLAKRVLFSRTKSSTPELSISTWAGDSLTIGVVGIESGDSPPGDGS